MKKIFGKKWSWKKRILIYVPGLVIFILVTNWYTVKSINHSLYGDPVSFSDVSRDNITMKEMSSKLKNDPSFAKIEKPVPFREIEPLDDDAHTWTTMFGLYSVGEVVFDANGDGLLDLYLTQNGDNWTRPSDENHVLMDKPRYQHNMLYLNQGNDENNNPIFISIEKLTQNNTFVEEELLVENFLYPRKSITDSIAVRGRKSGMAIAADFNADGRPDLLVGNVAPGMLWSHPETQRILPRFSDPIGRVERKMKLPLTALGMHLINYVPRHNMNDTLPSSRGIEPIGANSLFLNMGDKDNDGLPEWKDVSREANIEGVRNPYAMSVVDIDLDGDLDVYVANAMDGDYWPGGATKWAGGANELYINQLAQTGNLTFIEKAAEMNVDGLYDEENPMNDYYKLWRIPFLPKEYSVWLLRFIPYKPEYLTINGQEGEHGQLSWSTVFQDVNGDGYPDIWVANDLGWLRLYLNEEGKNFKQAKHARSEFTGMWMALAPADYDGNLSEDLYAGNLGGSLLNVAQVAPDLEDIFDPVFTGGLAIQAVFTGNQNSLHAIFPGGDYKRELVPKVIHSKILPPDTALPNNIKYMTPQAAEKIKFDIDSLHPYEFNWGVAIIDVQNDGRPDLYSLGALYGRGGGPFTILGTSPGRLLVNTTHLEEQITFVDLTAEHHLFNIEELKYDKLDEGYIYRKAPLQNWGKRDMVYSFDQSAAAVQGIKIRKKVRNHDLTQTAENGRGAVAADLNNDGFEDLVTRNLGGYDSRSSTAGNLKIKVNGVIRALPSHDYNIMTLTNFEPGRTRVFINQYTENKWIKVNLIDDTPGNFNRDGIGAKVVINDKIMKVKRASEGGFAASKLTSLHFGLGKQGTVKKIVVHWPDKARTITSYKFANLKNTTINISRTIGVLAPINEMPKQEYSAIMKGTSNDR